MDFDDASPVGVALAGFGWDSAPAVGVSLATSTTIYHGSSDDETLTEGQAKSDLLSVDRPGLTGNYVCAADGFKYLLVPMGVDAPTTIRDMATGFAVLLAGEDEGYGTVTNDLTHASLVIDGVTFRVYRSRYWLGSEITLQVA